MEVWLNDEWVKVGEYNWKQGESYLTRQESTVFTFDAVQTTRVRIVQPKGMGDGTNSRLDGQETTFSVLMWVGEIEIR